MGCTTQTTPFHSPRIKSGPVRVKSQNSKPKVKRFYLLETHIQVSSNWSIRGATMVLNGSAQTPRTNQEKWGRMMEQWAQATLKVVVSNHCRTWPLPGWTWASRTPKSDGLKHGRIWDIFPPLSLANFWGSFHHLLGIIFNS